MKVLINETEQVRNNLQHNENKKEVTELLKEKIEEVIMNDKMIAIVMVNSFSECRNTLYIEDYEADRKYFHINGNNFELHINSDNVTEIKYENTYDEQFVIKGKDNEVILIF